MGSRPTIEQLAAAAGVSVATVDRVLNKRAAVRSRTAQRVQEAAERIGYHASSLIAQRIRDELPQYTLGFLLLATGQSFNSEFASQLRRCTLDAKDFRGVARIEHANPTEPADIAGKILALGESCMAVAVVAPEHPAISAAVAELRERNIPVFALLSDVAAGVRSGYAGVHNGKVGRTAAWMIANSARQPGKVALFVGSHRFQGHEAREMGFRAYFREEAQDFIVMETLVNFEDIDVTHKAVLDLCLNHDDVVGCFVAGGGMEGAVAAMRELPPARRPVLVCNELTPVSSAALADKTVTMIINTPLAGISQAVVNLMAQSLAEGGASRAQDVYLPFEIFLPESI